MNTENQWKAKLKAAIEKDGGVCLSLHGHGMQASGWPDLWIGHRLYTGWIELKAHNGELRTDQKVVCRKLEFFQTVVILRADKLWQTCTLEDVKGVVMPGVFGILDVRAILGAL